MTEKQKLLISDYDTVIADLEKDFKKRIAKLKADHKSAISLLKRYRSELLVE